MKRLLTIAIIGLMPYKTMAQRFYYSVEVQYQLSDGSDQGTTITQLNSPNYEGVLASIQRYVQPERVKVNSLQITISRVPGTPTIGHGDKFKKHKKEKPFVFPVDSNNNSFQLRVGGWIERTKADSVVRGFNQAQGKLEDFLWINYPNKDNHYFEVRFAKKSCVFTSDTSFTYVAKFK